MENKETKGHLSAGLTILIWGTTFISTKVLLRDFQPAEILFLRFLPGLAVLCLICPRRLKLRDRSRELTFMAAGLCGICLYYLPENIALTYTRASNVGVIILAAPFFTAMITRLTGGKREAGPGNRLGIRFMLPVVSVSDFRFGPERFAKPENLGNLLFLGLGASALCFVTWNFAVRLLGPVKTGAYIYLVPVITVVASALLTGEKMTLMSIIGTLLTVAGLFLSEWKAKDGRTSHGKGPESGDSQKELQL